MGTGNVDLYGAQQPYGNQPGVNGQNKGQNTPAQGPPSANNGKPGSNSAQNAPVQNQTGKGAFSKMDQAIKPATDPARMNIGMGSEASSASKEGHAAERDGKGQGKANPTEKGVMSAGKDEGPGKGLQQEVKQVRREAMDVSKETAARGGTSSMGSVNSSLGQTGQMASRADVQHRQSKQKDLMSKMKDVAGNAMKVAGAAMDKAGTAMDGAGEGMVNAGRPMLSNPFTAAAGAALIAAGTALKIAGKAMKAAGKAMEKAGDALKKLSGTLKKDSGKFRKMASEQMTKGGKKVREARTQLQKMREANRKKQKGVSTSRSPDGVKPLDANVAQKADAASQRAKVNPAQTDRNLLAKAGERGPNNRVGTSKTLEDMNPSSINKANEMGANSKKLTRDDLALDPKTSAKLDKLDPKNMATDDALLKKAGQESPKDALGRMNQGSKTMEFPNPKTPPATEAAKSGSNWKKYAKWGAGGAAGIYVGHQMLGGGSGGGDSGGSGAPAKEERFKTWEEFNHHYGFDKPKPPINYQSGYTSYYASQAANRQNGNQPPPNNAMLGNTNTLFGPQQMYGYA
ncbi:MAG: hypothetical protein K0Q50_2763 [Vampirovibrio sp.]|jgi:hypothetical protein|nr:hypothetical protein [Vampirovibrio sp.]